MNWKMAKLLVDDYAKSYDISGDMKALLATLLQKEILDEKEVKDIISWGNIKPLNLFR